MLPNNVFKHHFYNLYRIMKRIGLLVTVCIVALTASAQKANYNIIPLPKEVKTDTTQQFVLKGGMGIAYDSSNAEIARTAEFLQQWVKEATGIQLQLVPEDKIDFFSFFHNQMTKLYYFLIT